VTSIDFHPGDVAEGPPPQREDPSPARKTETPKENQ